MKQLNNNFVNRRTDDYVNSATNDSGNILTNNITTIKCHSLYEEMHLRPYPRVKIPGLVGHLCVLKTDGKRLLFNLLHKIAIANNLDLPDISDVFYQRHCNDYKIRYEQHSEFETLTILLVAEKKDDIFVKNPFDLLPKQDFEYIEKDCDCLIKLIIELRDDFKQNQEINDFTPTYDFIFSKIFSNQIENKITFKPLINGSRIMQNRAEIFTSFRQDEKGYAKYLIFNKGLRDTSAGRLITCLVEFENYRILSLLGLQPAKSISRAIVDIDNDLANVMSKISSSTEHEDREILMQDLLDIAQKVENYRGQTSQRFAATSAYHSQVKSFFDNMNESRIPGFQSLKVFCDRRLNPAVATCVSVNSQLEHLSRRIDRIADLLRTEIDLNIENQNIRLLNAINERANMQIKMQHTVESISVVAISYYMLGILGYFLGLFLNKNHKEIILGISVIPIAVVVFLLQKAIIKRITKEEKS